MVFRRMLVAAAAILTLSVTPAAAGPVTFSDVFFFGTSELDAGNWLLDPQLMNDPVAPTAAKGYWNGRWKEGPTWSDYLSQSLLGTYSTPSLAGGTNYAFGNAWLGPLPGDVPQTSYEAYSQLIFGSQITAALNDYSNSLPADALYVISIGSNDPGPFYKRTDPAQADDRANIAIAEIQRLADAGAQYFLVQLLGGTDAWVNNYNAAMLSGLAGISGINVGSFTTRQFNLDVATVPGFKESLGITDFGSCVNFPVPCLGPAITSAQAGTPYLGNTHFNFDTIHRSTKMDAALADYALNYTPVPEPGTITLLATGLGAALIWRRKRARS